MKRLIILIAILNSLLCFSQQSAKTKTDSLSLISQKWQLVKSMIGKELQYPVNGDSYFIFYKDGKYQMLLNEEELLSGTWKFDAHKKTISTTDEEGEKVWTITKIIHTELVLATVFEGEKIVTYLKKAK